MEAEISTKIFAYAKEISVTLNRKQSSTYRGHFKATHMPFRQIVDSTSTLKNPLVHILVSHRRGGPMCPPVVGIANSPEMAKKRTMFPMSGHIGPPLRGIGRMGRNNPTYFLILMPHFEQKIGIFCGNAKKSVHAPHGYLSVGADPCVRPWQALQIC